MSAVLTTAGRKLALALSACFLAISSSFAQDASPLEVTNTAIATFLGPTEEANGDEPRFTATSNTVVAPINIAPPVLTVYNDPEHTNAPTSVDTGDDLYARITAPGCQHDLAVREWFIIDVKSLVSGDHEEYVAMETSPDSAVFDTARPIVTGRVSGPAMPLNDLLELWGEDSVEARVEGCGGVAFDIVLIDPDGVVYNSLTNEPVAGASVHLIDVTGAGNGGNAGGDAQVFDFDGVTELAPTIVTGADGRFQFPFVPASEYRIQVDPPAGFISPSAVPADQQPAGRTLNLNGSFGAPFSVNAQTGAVTLDMPIDPVPAGLVVEKRALRQTAEIGESLGYEVRMRNLSAFAISGLTLHDDLPPGFSYLPGSARIGDTPVADPVGGKGPSLEFAITSLAASAESTLSYRVVIGPGALEGDGTNRARLTGTVPAPQSSNVAKAKIEVQGGVFDDRAYVLGRVFADCNRNGTFDAGESGLPRVRLYMEDGSFVITDGEGKYSFYGVLPRTHVLKVDATTLPEGVKLAAISHRNAGRGDSRFLDVQRGELHRADFATDGCGAALAQQLETLRGKTNASRELDGVKNALRREENAVGDTRALPASGVVGETAPALTSLPRLAATGADAIAANIGRTALNALMPNLDAWLGFVDLYDGAEVGTTELTVRVKGQTGTDIRLSVNDLEVTGAHIGLKLEDPVRQVQAIEYVGVPLAPGANRLSLAQKDNNGHFREVVAVNVIAPGVLSQLKLATPSEGIPADGEHSAQVRVSVVDAAGVKVTSRTAVTLEALGGEWTAIDLDKVQPGTQVFIEGGEGAFGLRSRATGTARIRATAGSFAAEGTVSFVSALRPLIGVGVIEGTFNLDHLSGSALTRARSNDGFERELRNFGRDDGANGGARAALFLKGKIKGDYLLTLGYDSDKDTQERLFRDIQPDRFYPVYGDSSTRGYDAQTTGRLYVRVERNKSSFTGGDLTTASLSRARMMGAYNRSLTGVKEHFETEQATVEVFASYDTTRQIVDEIPANGTSGPYALSSGNLLENSERVEVLTRDRDQPAVIVAIAAKQRFVDYDIEPLTGRVVFRAAIPSVTPDLDPISIRVTYEVEQGGEEFWTTGMDSLLRVGKRTELGASYVDDRNPEDPRRISGLNATVKFGASTTLVAEGARTESLVSDGDIGARVELRHEGSKLTLRAFGSRTDENFDNPSGGFTKNREEAGAKAAVTLSERTRLVGELLSSADNTSNARREGGLVGVERSFAGNWKGEIGVRHVRASGESSPDDETTSVRARVTAPLPFARDAAVYGEYEQDIDDADARVAAIGGEYRLAPRSRLYARHEIISSLSGPYSLDAAEQHNTTVVGIDSTYWGDDTVFSEYRIADSLSGRDAQAAIGLRNAWTLSEGVRLSTSAEHVDSLGGDAGEESTAVAGGIEFIRKNFKTSTRIELRDSTSSDSALFTIGAARKINDEWTFLTRALFSIIDNESTEDRRQDRVQAGAAYRGDDNRVNALMRYEFKREDGLEEGLDRTVNIVSLHADLQQTTRLKFDGTVAAKLVAERFETTRQDAATLVASRVTYDLAKRWDLGMHVRGLFNKDFSGVQGGIGAEAGFLVTQNLWLSAGYNVLGFRDDDLAADEYTARGAYLRLRFKFDETVLP